MLMTFDKLYTSIISEGRKHKPIIVVDVQPAYSGIFDGDENPIFEDIIKFVNSSTGPVLMFVNAEQDGLTTDTIEDIKVYWEDYGFNRSWNDIKIVDKGYGYLRSWMDQGVKPSSIQKAIRIMYQQRINDSREIVEDMDDSLASEEWRRILNDPFIPEDSISVNWLSLKQLKQYEGGYLVGGGRKECLEEVELMMNTFNIRYRRIDSLIY